MAKDFNRPRYFVSIRGTSKAKDMHEEIFSAELTQEEFIQAERHHGFRPKYSNDGVATGGFSGGPFVSYSVRYDDLPEDDS